MAIHLSTSHLVLKEALKDRFMSSKPVAMDMSIVDFDHTQYRILVTEEAKTTLKFSISLRGCKSYLGPDYAASFEALYSNFMGSVAEEGYDLTLTIDLEQLPESEEEKTELAELFSKVKRNIIGAPMTAMAEGLNKGAPLSDSFGVEFRSGEHMFIIPSKDRITVCYALGFTDPTDKAIAKVFLQEFNEVKRLPGLGATPHPTFSTKPLGELTENATFATMIANDTNRIGFISFSFETRHLGDDKRESTLDHILQFRSYLDYHIKSSKSHLHSRMRLRVQSLLQVLNRAVPDIPHDKKEFKTASGATFRVGGGGEAGL